MAETDNGSGNTDQSSVEGVEPDEPDSRSDLEPSSGFGGEEFLFHLYRGSELLQDNCVTEAKDELERALSLQPRDVEGQGLLGIVYFRLGLYPRAISIYEEIVKSVPEELTPRINLALCYLKTGQGRHLCHCRHRSAGRRLCRCRSASATGRSRRLSQDPFQPVDDERVGASVLYEKQVAAVEEPELAAGDALLQGLHVLLGRDAVVFPADQQHRRGQTIEAVPGIVPAAGFELLPGPGLVTVGALGGQGHLHASAPRVGIRRNPFVGVT
jgi:hypothetical protein